MTTRKNNLIPRPPVVVVMGHVDHGKSSLLDYIRKSNIVAGEAGGITQHIGAYEIKHKNGAGEEKKITFIDTPGHSAFTEMRNRGAKIADIAILVVAGDDGVKPQTIEAISTITNANIPYIVAINKIDKPESNLDKTKQSLAESGVYVEGYGGTIPWVGISAKTGTGVDELIDLILLTADLSDLNANLNVPASGYVVESHRDSKTGVSATLIIKEGFVKKGMAVSADIAWAPIRNITSSSGEQINEAQMSSPVVISGWSDVPPVGSTFTVFENKKDAEQATTEHLKIARELKMTPQTLIEKKLVIPLVVKADVLGTVEAVTKELQKLENEDIGFQYIYRGIGPVTENDIRIISAVENPIVIGFNVKIDRAAKDLAENIRIPISIFNIIYQASEYLEKVIKERMPLEESSLVSGQIKILRTFSATKKKQVVGGEVFEGIVKRGKPCLIMRREIEIGSCKITGLQEKKQEVDKIEATTQCGLEVESKITIAPGDVLQVQ